MNKKKLIIVFIIITAVIMASCAAGPNTVAQAVKVEQPAGFLLGLWHGFIALFAFIISIFTDKVNLYEVYNNGGWYNFGFIIGVSIFFGGGGKGTGRRKRRN